jgi:hypothetical protein
MNEQEWDQLVEGYRHKATSMSLYWDVRRILYHITRET